MGQNITAFRPNDPVTRAEFGTTLSRALNSNDADKLAEMNAADPYYKEHLNFLKNEGIMTQIDNPSMTEVRGYVMLMMMRADESYTPVEGCTAEELLACVTADDYDACIAACNGEEEEEEQDPEEVKAGTLNVTMKSEEGGEFPSLVSSLPVATYTLKASEEDINVTSLVIEEGGYATANTLNAALYID
ncbi:S-layer homology domain-containing protein [bacterium]|nr:S-layer homology domain-containing protein [bacterium]